MMQVDHEATALPPGMAGAVRTAVNALGATVSVGLIVAVAVWGYKLAVRDVSGVPVVRALEGPMRMVPDDPGGMQAAHQGLAVNAVAAGRPASGAERVLLAPPPPDLAEALAQTAPVPVPQAVPAVERRDLAAEDAFDESSAALSIPSDAVLPASVPGIARSPVPRRRPAEDMLAESAARAILAALSPGAAVEVDPDALAPGTRLVQLGAFDDPETARSEWASMQARFGALLDGKGRVIQTAEAGGRTFYRLRVQGFGDEPEARRFCAVLIAENLTCIPVLIR